MSQVIFATVEDGVFKPDQGMVLSPGTKVRLTVEPCEESRAHAGEACDALDQLCNEIPIESREHRLNRDQLHDRH